MVGILSAFLTVFFSIVVGASCEGTDPDSAPTFPANAVGAQTYTVGTAVDAQLPAASGGDLPLTYSLSPALPSGLTFRSGSRTISGTPTSAQTQKSYSYTARDSDGDEATIQFPITVQSGGGSGSCRVGLVLEPGDSCTVSGEVFKVLSDGRGQYGCCIVSGQSITINGFVARRISGTDDWRIEALP